MRRYKRALTCSKKLACTGISTMRDYFHVADVLCTRHRCAVVLTNKTRNLAIANMLHVQDTETVQHNSNHDPIVSRFDMIGRKVSRSG